LNWFVQNANYPTGTLKRNYLQQFYV